MPTGFELAMAGYKYAGTPYSEMDCQAFIEKCLSDVGIHENLPGSNAWYRRMDWTGTPEECTKRFGEIPKGAFLFILANDGQEPVKYRGDGKGNANHIGIYTGAGKGAMHSSSSRGGVYDSEFHGKTIPNGGWNRVGLWHRIDYGIDIMPPDEDTGGDESMGTAVVHADSGNTVNMRESPRTTGALVMRVPVGSVVDVITHGDDWCRVSYNGSSGFMMTKFLQTAEASEDLMLISRTELEDIYHRLGGLLGL